MRSVPLVAALSAAAVMAVPAAAWAHGGAGAAYAAKVGGYEVYAYDPVSGPSPGRLEYRLILLDAAHDEPVDGATATVRATQVGGDRAAGPVVARSVANIYYYDLPDPGRGEWTVHLSIDGPLGPGSTTYVVHGLAEAAAAPNATPAADATNRNHRDNTDVLVGLGATAAVAAGTGGAVAYRRRRTPVKEASR